MGKVMDGNSWQELTQKLFVLSEVQKTYVISALLGALSSYTKLSESELFDDTVSVLSEADYWVGGR